MASLVFTIEDGDRKRWERENRQDILHVLENESPVWAGDHLISAKTGKSIQGCPFLKPDGDRFICTIYETRPIVCRNFTPGSSELCPLYKK